MDRAVAAARSHRFRSGGVLHDLVQDRRGDVELIAFHTGPSKLRIIQGDDVKTTEVTGSGLSAFRAPLVPGTTPKFEMERSGKVVLSLTSGTPIRTKTDFQDLVYCGGSTRESCPATVSD